MFRGLITGIVLTIAAALVGSYLVLQTGLIPANADAKPGPIEIWAAHTSLDATLDREAPTRPNPAAMTDANLIDGIKSIYATLRDMPRDGTGHRVGVRCRERSQSESSAIGNRGRGR